MGESGRDISELPIEEWTRDELTKAYSEVEDNLINAEEKICDLEHDIGQLFFTIAGSLQAIDELKGRLLSDMDEISERNKIELPTSIKRYFD